MEKHRIVGFLLVAVGVLLALLVVAWGGASMAEGDLLLTGFLLLLVLVLPIVAILVGAGFFVLRRATEETRAAVEVKRQRRILNAVQAQGQLSLQEVALDVNVPLDQIRQDVYDLVGKGLFSGYIDWDGGILYSRQARAMREAGNCPNCGGQLELAGKGVVRCPYCGTEIFL